MPYCRQVDELQRQNPTEQTPTELTMIPYTVGRKRQSPDSPTELRNTENYQKLLFQHAKMKLTSPQRPPIHLKSPENPKISENPKGFCRVDPQTAFGRHFWPKLSVLSADKLCSSPTTADTCQTLLSAFVSQSARHINTIDNDMFSASLTRM